jgi:hypothetical protein
MRHRFRPAWRGWRRNRDDGHGGSLMRPPICRRQIATGRSSWTIAPTSARWGRCHEMLAKQRPFPSDNREEVLSGILWDPRRRVALQYRVPQDLETIARSRR